MEEPLAAEQTGHVPDNLMILMNWKWSVWLSEKKKANRSHGVLPGQV